MEDKAAMTSFTLTGEAWCHFYKFWNTLKTVFEICDQKMQQNTVFPAPPNSNFSSWFIRIVQSNTPTKTLDPRLSRDKFLHSMWPWFLPSRSDFQMKELTHKHPISITFLFNMKARWEDCRVLFLPEECCLWKKFCMKIAAAFLWVSFPLDQSHLSSNATLTLAEQICCLK